MTSKDSKFSETRFPKMLLEIKQALQQAEKDLEVLEILKELFI